MALKHIGKPNWLMMEIHAGLHKYIYIGKYGLRPHDKNDYKNILNRIRQDADIAPFKGNSNFFLTYEGRDIDSEFFIYKDNLYTFTESDAHSTQERELLIKEHYYKKQSKFDKLKKEIQLFEKHEKIDLTSARRDPISENVRFAVWRRDKGRCVQCGSKTNLEFDHIIPISKGGSSTERNLQLLCEKCNRGKSAKI